MGKVIVVGFASPLHRHRITALSGVDAIIYEEGDVGNVKVGDSIPILLILSGGVSRIVERFVDLNGIRSAMILSHPSNNSLASAISARALLEEKGVAVSVYHLGSIDNVPKVIKVMESILKIKGSKIALVGVNEKGGVGEAFERKFNAKVDAIPMSLLEEAVSNVKSNDAKSFMDDVLDRLAFEVPLDKLINVGKIYVALLNMARNYDALALNCFPYLIKHGVTPCLALAKLNEEGKLTACEYDLKSLFLMMIFHALTGYSGWIANVNDIEGNLVRASHCTIALNMIKSGKVVTHYESGNPYSISAEINAKTVTAASVSPDFNNVYVFTGSLNRSGDLGLNACRTQAEIKVNFDPSIILNYAPANHHVIVPGNYINELTVFLRMLGVNVVKYSSLI
ncbi:fucose isomerase [Caldivirga sp. UBA161]|uniref:fucose isomerase n=1 Tax=Caldivirga sp. UBA161 TaxID=1915569 RepID=UPI0025C71658|nr:fucose isomerase [Caldivirga sp. UBA161]